MVLNMKACNRGFTLVELMVTLVILVLLLMTAVPLTQSWINSASVMETKTLLQQAYGRTRGLALANPAGISDGSASAYLCVLNSKIYVQPISAATCGTGSVWSGDIKASASITVGTTGTTNFICMGLSNLGLPVALTLAGGACTTNKTLKVTKGSEQNDQALY